MGNHRTTLHNRKQARVQKAELGAKSGLGCIIITYKSSFPRMCELCKKKYTEEGKKWKTVLKVWHSVKRR